MEDGILASWHRLLSWSVCSSRMSQTLLPLASVHQRRKSHWFLAHDTKHIADCLKMSACSCVCSNQIHCSTEHSLALYHGSCPISHRRHRCVSIREQNSINCQQISEEACRLWRLLLLCSGRQTIWNYRQTQYMPSIKGNGQWPWHSPRQRICCWAAALLHRDSSSILI